MSNRAELANFTGRLAVGRREAAAALGVSERHVINEIKRGKIREKRSGKRSLIPVQELERYLADQEQSEGATA